MDRKYKVGGYVKLAKQWERSKDAAVAYHSSYYAEKFRDDADKTRLYTTPKRLQKRKTGICRIFTAMKEKDGMMPRKMQLSFRLKKMNKVPSRLKSVQLDITSIWSYNTSKWT